MSKWSELGLPGEPLTPAVEQMAQYVQWAVYGVSQGLDETATVYFDPNWTDVFTGQWWRRVPNLEEIRYNLSVVDSMKAAALQYAPDEATKRQVYRLIVVSEGLKYLIETIRIENCSPSYWAYFRTYLFGGTPARPQTVAMANEAKRAAAAAAIAARAAGIPDLATFYENAGSGVDQLVRDSDAFWSEPGVLNVSGMAWWMWAGLAIGGAFLLSELR